MRYRIGEPPAAGTGLDQGFFLAIALLSLFIGASFVLAGLRSRHYWMTIWGTGLTLSSIGYIVLVIVTT